MAYTADKAYGQALINSVRATIPTFGRLFVVMASGDAAQEMYQRVEQIFKTDLDGKVRFFTSLLDAYNATTSNNNDVILLDGEGTHVLAEALDVSKSRVHFMGMDSGGRLIQQGTKIQNTDGTAAVYVIKNTGTRNTFRNIKFIQVDDDATSLTCFQEGGEGTLFKNCSFTFGVVDNLDQTDAYEFVHGGDSVTMIDCTFGQDTILTSAGRTVMAIDQVKSGQPFKNNILKDCLWMISTSSTDLSFIRVLSTADVNFGNVFINSIMMNALVSSMSAAATDDAVDSVSSLLAGNLLFVNPATNATKFCSDVTDQVQVVGPTTTNAAGLSQTPA